MQEIIYINVDDEITNVLDKVRQQEAREIFLIVPQGATFLNSILNLKILRKEVEKMGKSLTVVTPNDQRSRTIVERAGLKTQDYQQVHRLTENKTVPEKEKYRQREVQDASEKSLQEVADEDLKIGSKTFYVRNGNLNSPNYSSNQNSSSRLYSSSSSQDFPISQSVIQNQPVIQKTKEDKEYNYFHQKEFSRRKKGQRQKKKKKKILIFWLLAIFLIFFLSGAGYYLVNYPKLFVKIKPRFQLLNEEIKFSVDARVKSADLESKIIPGEYLEMTVSKKKEFKTTGEKVLDKNGAKAKGVVIIRNYYSNKPQPLVKTTRVLSKSGKLFRLTKSIIVPGMKNEQPGEIAVPVEADKPGQEYNIGPETFTIEGFKGGPKYTKFKVESKKGMSGGVTSSEHKVVSVVSKRDLDEARKHTIEELDKELKEEIQKRIGGDKVFLESAVEKEIVSSESSHLQDSIADDFTYTIIYKLKLIALLKSDLNKLSEYLAKNKLGTSYEIDKNNMKFQLKRGIANLSKRTMTVYGDLKAVGWFKIDKENLQKKLVDKNLSELKEILAEKNGIDRAVISFSPVWVNHSPKQMEKIKLRIIKNSEESTAENKK